MNTIKSFFAASFFAIAIPVFSFSGIPPANIPSTSAPTAVNSGVGTNTSLNWSGYVASQGTFTSVSGAWNVPSVANATGTAAAADATWIGIGGVSSHDLIQAGTQAVTDPSGSVTYEAWYELLPSDMQTIPLLVDARGSVSVSIAQTSPSV